MAREGWKCLEIAFSLPTGKQIKGGSNWPARNFWSHPEKLAASGLDAELRPESSAIIGAGRGVGGASADRPSPTPSLPPSPRRPRGCSRAETGRRGWQPPGRRRCAPGGFGFQTPSSALSRVGVPWTGTRRAGCLLPLLPIKTKSSCA